MIQVPESQICQLCGKRADYFAQIGEKRYYRCCNCFSVILDPAAHPSTAEEKLCYDKHKNNIDDPGYRNFVRLLVEAVVQDCVVEKEGLDYGVVPGPVAAAMLGKKGYRVKLYDIFYHPDESVLNKSYDFIICSEVIEHFRLQADECRKLRRLLRPGGWLYCMTEIYTEGIDFKTGLTKMIRPIFFFYHPPAFQWIEKNIGFTSLFFKGRVIIYRG